MNEKKAIVFFFVVVVFFFFCFSFLLLVVVVVAASTYVTYVFLSFVLCFGCVCVFFFSSSFASLTCASVCSYVCDCVCVCVFQFPLFAAVVVFFSGASQFQTLPFLRTLFLLFRFYVVIRGGVFLHFFFHVSNKTRTHVHTYRHGHTDGRTEGEKCARAASFGKHTQNYFAFFIVVCYCYYYGWLLLLFTFHGMLLGVINKQRQSALHAHTLVRGVGGTIHNFSTLPRCTFWKLASSSSATSSSSLSLFWVVSF